MNSFENRITPPEKQLSAKEEMEAIKNTIAAMRLDYDAQAREFDEAMEAYDKEPNNASCRDSLEKISRNMSLKLTEINEALRKIDEIVGLVKNIKTIPVGEQFEN